MSDFYDSGASGFESAVDAEKYPLNEYERDALGEIGNICMGTSATTLSSILGKKVSITTPHVVLSNNMIELGRYQKPYVAVEVSYTAGIDGYNVLLMKNEDVLMITDLLMGGSGTADPAAPVGDMELSTISEVMNQMVGSSCTSLSNILKMPVNIAPPIARSIILEEDSLSDLPCGQETVIAIRFSMVIQGVLNSEIMQIMPFPFGKKLVSVLLSEMNGTASEIIPIPVPPQGVTPPAPAAKGASPVQSAPPPVKASPRPENRTPYPPQPHAAETNRVSVKAMQYQNFDEPQTDAQSGKPDYGDSLGLILDVPLQVTVELGQCKKSIKDILGLSMGSVVVLNRMAGEMVDIMVNGKLFARGEVVVIDDNYGVRVTEIITPQSGHGKIPF